MIIRKAVIKDIPGITKIYNHYILNSSHTFEEDPVTLKEMSERFQSTVVKYPWLVAADENGVAGYAYAVRWKPRSAYRYAAESTIYLSEESKGIGIGRLLYSSLISELMQMDIHCVMGGITLPNDASVRLHEALGFKKVAHFSQIGFKFNTWLDVGYWQLILNGYS